MQLEVAWRELAQEIEESKDASTPDSRFHRARRVLIAAAVDALAIKHVNGLSIGDVLQRAIGASPTASRQAFAVLVMRALATERLIFSSDRSDIDRFICSLAESAFPQVLKRFDYGLCG